jgi:hypothetical protein
MTIRERISRFITTFTRFRYWFLFQARWIPSTPQHSYFKIHLNHMLMFINEMFLFQVSLKIQLYAVILLYASSSMATFFFRPGIGMGPYYGTARGYGWRTGMSQNYLNRPAVTKPPNNAERPLSTPPPCLGGNSNTPNLKPNTNSQSSTQYVQKTNDRVDGEGIEHVMLQSEGDQIPEQMQGLNYDSDTNGWPRFISTTTKPVYKVVKTSQLRRL